MLIYPATAPSDPLPRPSAVRGQSRAMMAEEVREVRARLSQGTTLKPEFEYELLCMFARNERSALITIPTLAVISVFALMFWAPNDIAVLGWCALVIATKFFMTATCGHLLAAPRPDMRLDTWRQRLTFLELVSGLSWAGMALVGTGTTDPASHVFVLAALIVLLAVRMTFASTVMSVLYAGTIPMTIAVVLRLGWQWHPFYFAMAFMAIGLQVYIIFLAKGLNSTALAMIEYRAEKDALIAELEGEKSISDEARRRAEGANVAKSRFLATMSHELRTPLNAILGFSEVMQTELLGPLDNAHYKEYAGNIHDSGRHLLHLINEILDLSRIEAGRYDLNEEPVRLADVAEDCIRLLKLRAEAKGLVVQLQGPRDLAQLWIDERATRQICLNLLSNAIKFTPRGGHIEVVLSRTTDGGQMLAVKDNGPGIPKDEIPRVMQAFGQGSLAHQTAEGGTGLGLPIVKSLIELHGGSFELQSELRKGTMAMVRFPLARVLQAMPPLQPFGQERHRKGLGVRAQKAAPGPTAKPSRPARIKAETR